VVFAQVKHGINVDVIVDHLLHAWAHAMGADHQH